jgi:arginine-tRNA-protein transferase
MAYKTRYRPVEVLGPLGWSRYEDAPTAPKPRLDALA